MALREFTDSAGQAWEAFAVIPREHERRQYDRRSDGSTIDDEDRRERDRRITVGRTSSRFDAHGWLCFQHGDERRRLAPIPDDWTRCDASQLQAYLASAQPVRRLSSNAHRTQR